MNLSILKETLILGLTFVLVWFGICHSVSGGMGAWAPKVAVFGEHSGSVGGLA